MKRISTLLSLLVVVCITLLTCVKEIKTANGLGGNYTGKIIVFGNSSIQKDLSLNITSQDNPVAGTYNLAGTAGTVSGSVLGSILDLTFKPSSTGTTYTFSGNANGDNTAITGTMTGVESGTTVKYNVELKK